MLSMVRKMKDDPKRTQSNIQCHNLLAKFVLFSQRNRRLEAVMGRLRMVEAGKHPGQTMVLADMVVVIGDDVVVV